MSAIPVLQTERLILRGHALDDFPAYAEMWANEHVTRFIGGKPLTEEEAWSKFMRMAGQWTMLGFGFFAVAERASGRLIGETGFVEGRRAIEPSLIGVPEIGWGFVPAFHGKGYAFEAALAARDWGEAHFGKVPMRCIIAPENTPSIRLAQKLGFTELLRTTYRGDPTVMFERKP
ncbi:MAG TPA: GNAT family N-acetyltransferase [Rhizomicrobium sp.]|nr:GNAT family N-acetyltransferase [Rhizomicrobium sp.]